MSMLAELQEKREELFQAMKRATKRPAGQTEEQTEQFLHGYLGLIEAAVQGNLQPRNDYLAAVIPGTKSVGMTLGYVMATLVDVNMALASVISRENLPWYIEFCHSYAEDLIQIWEASPSN